MEVYRGRLILFGCGDFINDYEGIHGHEEWKPDLALGYFIDLDERGNLSDGFEMVPFRRRKFRLERATTREAAWLADALRRESTGCRIAAAGDGVLTGIHAGE